MHFQCLIFGSAFVKTSAIISPVGMYSISIIPFVKASHEK
jgi:hypothetical protein